MKLIHENCEEDSNSDNFNSEAEEFPSEEEVYKPSYAKDKKKKFHVAPKIFFSPENIPKLTSEHMQLSQPITKNSSFSVNISNNTMGLIKGQLENPISLEKFNIKTRDSEMSDIFSHINSRFSVHEIPDNCFSISPSSRYPLKNAYKMLSKQQEVLKALFHHAELNIIRFDIRLRTY